MPIYCVRFDRLLESKCGTEKSGKCRDWGIQVLNVISYYNTPSLDNKNRVRSKAYR